MTYTNNVFEIVSVDRVHVRRMDTTFVSPDAADFSGIVTTSRKMPCTDCNRVLNHEVSRALAFGIFLVQKPEPSGFFG